MHEWGRCRVWGSLVAVVCLACSSESASSSKGHVFGDAGTMSHQPDAGALGGGFIDVVEPAPSPSIGVEPRDLTTDYTGKKVDIAVSLPFGGAPDRTWIDSGVTLGDGSGASVATSAAFVNESDGQFTYELTLTDPVADGWYTLTITPPQGARIGYGAPEQPAPLLAGSDGKYESRFRVGSEPLLLSVALCASKDLTLLPKLIVWFSEPVNLPASSPFEVRANGTLASCKLNMAPTAQEPMAEYTCTPPIPAGADVQVTTLAGITAVDGGLPLTSATGPIPLSVTVPAIDQNGSCRTFRESRLPL